MLQLVKIGGLKDILPLDQSRTKTQAAWVRERDDRIILQFCQVVTLPPFDLQRPTLPLLKDLAPVVNILSAQGMRGLLRYFLLDQST